MLKHISTKRTLAITAAMIAVIVVVAIIFHFNRSDEFAGHHTDSFSNQNHGSSTKSSVLPTEVGQSAFAAIAEIVQILNLDASTDWSKVDINALREHLVDMNELTLNAKIDTMVGAEKITFTVTGDSRTSAAIKRMVPAHSSMLEMDANKIFSSQQIEILPNGVSLILETNTPAQLTKLSAIGFFGYMATGAHHQAHHLSIAQGMPQH